MKYTPKELGKSRAEVLMVGDMSQRWVYPWGVFLLNDITHHLQRDPQRAASGGRQRVLWHIEHVLKGNPWRWPVAWCTRRRALFGEHGSQGLHCNGIRSCSCYERSDVWAVSPRVLWAEDEGVWRETRRAALRVVVSRRQGWRIKNAEMCRKSSIQYIP